MDDNLSWKIIYLAAIFSMVVMVFAYFMISPQESAFFTEEKMEKIAEFKNTRVAGRKAGKKVWEFFAEEGWTTKDREVTFLFRVSKGSMYMAGKLVVNRLKAPWAKTYQRSEIVEVFGYADEKKKGPSRLSGYIELGRISDKPREAAEWTRLVSDHLKYIPALKRTEISDNVKLFKKDSSIFAQKITVEHEEKIAYITGGATLVRPDGKLTAETMRYHGESEDLVAQGGVAVNLQEGALKTRIKSSSASFSIDMSKDMVLSGNPEVIQGKKAAVGQRAVYSQRKKELLLSGEAKAVFEKAAVILKEGTAGKLRNPEGQKILKEKTVLTAEEIVFATDSGDARATGSVHVSQKGREARSERAVYDDQNEALELTGNVHMKKEAEWVSARKVVVSVKDETFEAFGEVEAQLKL